MNYYNELLNCMENIGILVMEREKQDIDLSEYLVDSLMFVSLIVEVENYFQIEIPDIYLSYQTVSSLRGFSNLIETLHKESEKGNPK